jgi:predicted phosphodiesterase
MSITVDPTKFKRIAVVGDTNGDYNSLKAIIKQVNLQQDLVIFLGDYADRGRFGIELIRQVVSLRQKYPENIIALKGNHEDISDNGNPNFYSCTIIEEANEKVGSWSTYFRNEFKPFIDSLYLAAIIPNGTLFVHGEGFLVNFQI